MVDRLGVDGPYPYPKKSPLWSWLLLLGVLFTVLYASVRQPSMPPPVPASVGTCVCPPETP